jgi:hypothetical protein
MNEDGKNTGNRRHPVYRGTATSITTEPAIAEGENSEQSAADVGLVFSRYSTGTLWPATCRLDKAEYQSMRFFLVFP